VELVSGQCGALNAPSRTAAQRWGLSFERIFRQALIVEAAIATLR